MTVKQLAKEVVKDRGEVEKVWRSLVARWQGGDESVKHLVGFYLRALEISGALREGRTWNPASPAESEMLSAITEELRRGRK